jgi:2',3'-cyclic-nucleotide 2'-phosphodiesterase (5'-nucleotidase family)
MKNLLIFFVINCLTFSLCGQSKEQVFAEISLKGKKEYYSYQPVCLDSTFDKKRNEEFQATLDIYKGKLHDKMNKKIGESEARLTSFYPASPLSNLLTDLVFQFAQQYKIDSTLTIPIDCSLLNFGGIRASLPQGKVTVGDIYKILPFENKVVIISLKGSELQKIFQRFTEKKNQPYSQLKIDYYNGNPVKILLNSEKIDDNRIYGLVTVDFIARGGDKILQDIHFDNVIYTSFLLRDVIIGQIKKLTKQGKNIPAIVDERVSIQVQNPQ